MVKGDPAAIIRARWLASRTSSNRLSTLSMQSSTVTRAIAAPVLQGLLKGLNPRCYTVSHERASLDLRSDETEGYFISCKGLPSLGIRYADAGSSYFEKGCETALGLAHWPQNAKEN